MHHINKINKAPHNRLNRFRKTFDKTQRFSIIKALNKLGLEGNLSNLIKGISEKPTATIIVNGESLDASLLRFGDKTRMPTLATFSPLY